MVRQEILSRLICAKYLFLSGVETLNRPAPFASGLAVVAFQDSAELVLRAIAEHTHAQIKENTAFQQIIDEIEKATSTALTYRTALNQLNKVRVNFKHFGIAPRDEDARKFKGDLEGFFPSVARQYLDVDFDHLSLSSLIRHTRTRNWVAEAERHLSDGKILECIDRCAVAMQLCLRARRQGHPRPNLRSAARFDVDSSNMGVVRGISDLVAATEEQLRDIHEHLDLIGHGVSYGDYQRFLALAPPVHFTGDGRPHRNWLRTRLTEDDARFCFSFTQNTILSLQDQYLSEDRFGPRATGRVLRTTANAVVVVHPPKEGQTPEVLLELAAGTEVHECASHSPNESYLSVLVDGECAYISKAHVQDPAPNSDPIDG